jgi:hypothetical protein
MKEENLHQGFLSSSKSFLPEQYNDFNYWKPKIPFLEELANLEAELLSSKPTEKK